jgi:hypothetical protein
MIKCTLDVCDDVKVAQLAHQRSVAQLHRANSCVYTKFKAKGNVESQKQQLRLYVVSQSPGYTTSLITPNLYFKLPLEYREIGYIKTTEIHPHGLQA